MHSIECTVSSFLCVFLCFCCCFIFVFIISCLFLWVVLYDRSVNRATQSEMRTCCWRMATQSTPLNQRCFLMSLTPFLRLPYRLLRSVCSRFRIRSFMSALKCAGNRIYTRALHCYNFLLQPFHNNHATWRMLAPHIYRITHTHITQYNEAHGVGVVTCISANGAKDINCCFFHGLFVWLFVSRISEKVMAKFSLKIWTRK